MNTESQSGRQTLVFVDDDNITNILVQRLLARTSFDVHTFTETDLARSFIDSNKVHVLIVDLRMPAVDGIEFLQSLNIPSRSHTINRIIIQTGAEPEISVIETVKSLGYELIIKDELLGSRENIAELLVST